LPNQAGAVEPLGRLHADAVRELRRPYAIALVPLPKDSADGGADRLRPVEGEGFHAAFEVLVDPDRDEGHRLYILYAIYECADVRAGYEITVVWAEGEETKSLTKTV
jgi:hypothetical protein